MRILAVLAIRVVWKNLAFAGQTLCQDVSLKIVFTCVTSDNSAGLALNRVDKK